MRRKATCAEERLPTHGILPTLATANVGSHVEPTAGNHSDAPADAVAEPEHVLGTPLNGLSRWFSSEALYRAEPFRAELRSHIDEEFDTLWQRADKRGRLLGVRNARYLRWRYEQHPLTRYRAPFHWMRTMVASSVS